MRKLLWLGLLGVLVGCAQLAGPAFIRVELDGPPGFASHKLSRLEVVATTQIDGETATQTVLFDAQGLALPLSFVLEVIDPKERGLEVSLTVLGFTEGATQPVLFAQGEARARRDRIDLLADFCGDGKLDDVLAEQCDDGNLLDGDGCSSFCQVEVVCGNGVEDDGEECDDGNGIEGDGCDTNCTFSACGNGILAPGESCFTEAGSFPVGLSPQAVVSADFNGDGLLDLATANQNSDNLSVLFNEGGGLFGGQVPLEPLNSLPKALQAADLDGDGDFDLAVAATGDNVVRVFENNGAEGFARRGTFQVGNGPGAMAVGDLNRDSLPDLVTANAGSQDLSILLNNFASQGVIGFLPAQSLAAVPFPDAHIGVAIGEVSLDPGSNLDVVASVVFEAGIRPEIGVLEGLGDGGFFAPESFQVGPQSADSINSIAIGELNGDGINDVVISHTGLSSFGVLLGTGAGNQGGELFFAEQLVEAGGGQRALTLGDLNADGALDVVVLDIINSVVRVLFGQGDGQFALAQEISVGNRLSALVLADLDGDGLLDIAVSDELANSVFVLLQAP